LTGAVPFSAPSHIAVATMHVREEIPDLQLRRPEVSAALAAVVERATAKHLARRYANARELIADLEEVLAIETARTGDAGREATLVIRSMPAQTTRRVPVAVRHPVALIVAVIASVAAVAAVIAFVVASTHRGVGAPSGLARAPHEQVVRLGQTAAVQYNPFGTAPEDPSTVEQAIDGNIATSWQTSFYDGGVLGKSGVGLYVDAAPDAAANEAVVVTPTPGFHFQIWGTDRVPSITYTPAPRAGPTPLSLGWTLLGGGLAAGTTTVRLSHVRERLYYLLWITDLGPDPSHAVKSVQIAEFELRQRA
jgi:serine/threonine-protein kinase